MAYEKKIDLNDFKSKVLRGAVPLTKILRCGVYFLINDGEINYIGQSICVESRINVHRRDRSIPFDSVYIFETKREKLAVMEAYFIDKMSPIYNLVKPCASEILRRKRVNLEIKNDTFSVDQLKGSMNSFFNGRGIAPINTPPKERTNYGPGIVTPRGFYPTVKWAAEDYKISVSAVYTKINHSDMGWCVYSEEEPLEDAVANLPKMRGRRPVIYYSVEEDFLREV